MKKHITKFVFTAFIFFTVSGAFAYESNGTGSWHTDSIWESGESTPLIIGNDNDYNASLTILSPDSIYLGNIEIIEEFSVNKNDFTFHIHGKLTIGALKSSRPNNTTNNTVINIYSGGVFTILQDFQTNNNLIINIAEGGFLNIQGTLEMNNNADIIINGEFSANIISGNNNNDLLGNGVFYMPECSDMTGVNFDDFNGVIACGNTNLDLPRPTNFDGSELYEDNTPTFNMSWKFNYSGAAEVEHIGFQILRHNGEDDFWDAPVIGHADCDNGLDVQLTVCPLANLYVDEELLMGQFPRYYVRAVYKIGDNIVFSGLAGPIGPTSPLPIELISFQATSQQNNIKTSWTTATETNNMGFEIQRLDATNQNWDVIGFVDGNYNHNGILHYSFMDYSPFSGINYYRLKQMDLDGAFEFFGPVAAWHGVEFPEAKIQIMKTSGNTYIVVPGYDSGQLEVFDIHGRLQMSAVTGGKVPVNLGKGTYIVRFFNGYETLTAKFIL